MTVYVAFLRAVNVGGTGMLTMKALAALCTELGFANVRTYIQSGNVVFTSALAAHRARVLLERALTGHMGRKVDVMLRDGAELRRILEANPFPGAQPSTVAVAFWSAPVPRAIFEKIVAPGGEKIVVGEQEVYVHYPDGMGRSKLKFPKTDGVATVRNINTVSRLVAMADEVAASQRPVRG